MPWCRGSAFTEQMFFATAAVGGSTLRCVRCTASPAAQKRQPAATLQTAVQPSRSRSCRQRVSTHSTYRLMMTCRPLSMYGLLPIMLCVLLRRCVVADSLQLLLPLLLYDMSWADWALSGRGSAKAIAATRMHSQPNTYFYRHVAPHEQQVRWGCAPCAVASVEQL
jgi:hypothetical protein